MRLGGGPIIYFLPYPIPKRSAWLLQTVYVCVCVCGATSGKEPERMYYGSIESSPRSGWVVLR